MVLRIADAGAEHRLALVWRRPCVKADRRLPSRLNLRHTRELVGELGSSAPVHEDIDRPAPPTCSRFARDIVASADHGGEVPRAQFYEKRRSAAQPR